MDNYLEGFESAIKDLGLTKTAAPLLSGVGRAVMRGLPTAGGVRDFFIGNPRRFGEELISGKALGKNSLIRESFQTPGMLSKALFYGLPAIDVAQVAMDDDPNKARRIGESVGGAALGMAAYKPLGMLGSIAADTVGRRSGGILGGTLGHVTGLSKNVPDPVTTDPALADNPYYPKK